ncbi:hypothetical protein [Streptosporangium sp. G12]
MPEQYKRGERIRITVDGVIEYDREPDDQPGRTAELTIAVSTGAGLYDVTVPLDYVVAAERLVPAQGEPQPGEIWRDRDGVERFASKDRSGQVVLRGAAGTERVWQNVNATHGPLTRVYPASPAPEPERPPVPEQNPAAPELRVGDVWKDRDGDVWDVFDASGKGGLRHGTLEYSWDGLARDYGPLTLLIRGEAPASEGGAV